MTSYRQTTRGLLLLLACACCVAAQRGSTKSEQNAFGAEAPVKRPVKLPADVLRQLVDENAQMLRACLQRNGESESDIPRYFAASRVNINHDAQQDLVVQAGEYCLQGAHSTPFWIFTQSNLRVLSGYELVLSVSADSLRILRASTNGYRDIESGYFTALEAYNTIWRFDGERYQPRVCTVQDFRTKKVVRVKCGQIAAQSGH